jgi:hypothetical protein
MHQGAGGVAGHADVKDSRATIENLARECMDLIGQRNSLDKAIPLLPADSADRDRMWHNLDEVMTSLTAAIGELAAKPGTGQADLRHKAAVLTTVLRRELAETLPPGQEVLALCLSLAEDVHRLTSEVSGGVGAV